MHNQSAAIGPRLAGGAAIRTTQVGAGDAEHRRFASPRALRSDVVEDAIVAKAELVHGYWRNDVSLTDGHVASMIEDSLVAAEGTLLRQIPERHQARRSRPGRS